MSRLLRPVLVSMVPAHGGLRFVGGLLVGAVPVGPHDRQRWLAPDTDAHARLSPGWTCRFECDDATGTRSSERVCARLRQAAAAAEADSVRRAA